MGHTLIACLLCLRTPTRHWCNIAISATVQTGSGLSSVHSACLRLFAHSRVLPVLSQQMEIHWRAGFSQQKERERENSLSLSFSLSWERRRKRRRRRERERASYYRSKDRRSRWGTREYRYFLEGPQDQTCNLYIAPYLPVAGRTLRKYTIFFTTSKREEYADGDGKKLRIRATQRKATVASSFLIGISVPLFFYLHKLYFPFSLFLFVVVPHDDVEERREKTVAGGTVVVVGLRNNGARQLCRSR